MGEIMLKKFKWAIILGGALAFNSGPVILAVVHHDKRFLYGLIFTGLSTGVLVALKKLLDITMGNITK